MLETFGVELFVDQRKHAARGWETVVLEERCRYIRSVGGVGFRERYLKLFWIRDAVEKLDPAGSGELICKGLYVTPAPGTWAVGAPVLGSHLDFHFFRGIGLALY